MLLLVSGALAAAGVLVALQATRAQRTLEGEVRRLRDQLQDLGDRLAFAEKSADDAATQAEAAETVLIEKGLANEEELEAARRRWETPPDPTATRTSRTLH
jgi:hypothetical protein